MSISDTPSTFDIIYEAEGDPGATIQVGSMVFSLAQFQALLPFPQVALPYMHVPSHYGPLPVTFYGVVLPTAEREALATHPNPFMPGYRLWEGLGQGVIPPEVSFLHHVHVPNPLEDE